MIDMPDISLNKSNLPTIMKDMINKYINNHKLSQIAHEEITAMTHSDKDVAYYFHKKDMEMTKRFSNILIENNFKINNMDEKVHVVIGLIDNLCHEIVYHKHKELDYDLMTDIAVNTIVDILTKND